MFSGVNTVYMLPASSLLSLKLIFTLIETVEVEMNAILIGTITVMTMVWEKSL